MQTMTMTRFQKGLAAVTAGIVLGFVSLVPMSAFADQSREAFKQTSLKAAMQKFIGNAQVIESKQIKINAPIIAENGTEVSVGVATSIPKAEQVLVFAEKNQNPLVASYRFAPGTSVSVRGRMKLRKASNVIALVKANGKYYKATHFVKVTSPGCGGST
jgi:sulfur-oxidizing protein SoxY